MCSMSPASTRSLDDIVRHAEHTESAAFAAVRISPETHLENIKAAVEEALDTETALAREAPMDDDTESATTAHTMATTLAFVRNSIPTLETTPLVPDEAIVGGVRAALGEAIFLPVPILFQLFRGLIGTRLRAVLFPPSPASTTKVLVAKAGAWALAEGPCPSTTRVPVDWLTLVMIGGEQCFAAADMVLHGAGPIEAAVRQKETMHGLQVGEPVLPSKDPAEFIGGPVWVANAGRAFLHALYLSVVFSPTSVHVDAGLTIVEELQVAQTRMVNMGATIMQIAEGFGETPEGCSRADAKAALPLVQASPLGRARLIQDANTNLDTVRMHNAVLVTWCSDMLAGRQLTRVCEVRLEARRLIRATAGAEGVGVEPATRAPQAPGPADRGSGATFMQRMTALHSPWPLRTNPDYLPGGMDAEFPAMPFRFLPLPILAAVAAQGKAQRALQDFTEDARYGVTRQEATLKKVITEARVPYFCTRANNLISTMKVGGVDSNLDTFYLRVLGAVASIAQGTTPVPRMRFVDTKNMGVRYTAGDNPRNNFQVVSILAPPFLVRISCPAAAGQQGSRTRKKRACPDTTGNLLSVHTTTAHHLATDAHAAQLTLVCLQAAGYADASCTASAQLRRGYLGAGAGAGPGLGLGFGFGFGLGLGSAAATTTTTSVDASESVCVDTLRPAGAFDGAGAEDLPRAPRTPQYLLTDTFCHTNSGQATVKLPFAVATKGPVLHPVSGNGLGPPHLHRSVAIAMHAVFAPTFPGKLQGPVLPRWIQHEEKPGSLHAGARFKVFVGACRLSVGIFETSINMMGRGNADDFTIVGAALCQALVTLGWAGTNTPLHGISDSAVNRMLDNMFSSLGHKLSPGAASSPCFASVGPGIPDHALIIVKTGFMDTGTSIRAAVERSMRVDASVDAFEDARALIYHSDPSPGPHPHPHPHPPPLPPSLV